MTDAWLRASGSTLYLPVYPRSFDEFNRIEVSEARPLCSRRCPCALPLHARPCAPSQVEVLSVVAQQIMAIMEAIKARKSEFIFMDRMVKCNWQCAWRGRGRSRSF